MRPASKASLYRNEITEAAVAAVRSTIERIAAGAAPEPLDYGRPDVRGRWRPLMKQSDRAIDWQDDDSATVLRKIRCADGVPGVADRILELPVHLYDAHPEGELRGAPGALIAQRHGAICRATRDGAVWITHLRGSLGEDRPFKLPAAMVLGERLAGVPEVPVAIDAGSDPVTWRDIRYEEFRDVGVLHFPFYNGAMSTSQCERLTAAYRDACNRPTRVIVLAGGTDFWSNGIHLNVIEASAQAADESWRNINAIDDLAHAILTTTSHLTVSALQGSAGAGGVFLALAADRVVARSGVVLNPHYKGMGNLYGSEYWTYLLPQRVGADGAKRLTEARLPLGTQRRTGHRADRRAPWRLARGLPRRDDRPGAGPCPRRLRAAAGRQAGPARRRRSVEAAGRLPHGRTGAHAAQFLRVRSQLPRSALQLRTQGTQVAHPAVPRPAPRAAAPGRTRSGLIRPARARPLERGPVALPQAKAVPARL